MNMELDKIISRAKQMQKTMKADKIDNVALEAMLKEVVKCKDEIQAQNFWSSIRAYCKTIPNSPFTVSRSNLPIEVQEVMATIKAEVIEASTTFFNTGNISRVLTKHGKSGGGLFRNADEYASMIDLKFGFTVHDAGDYFIKTRVSGIEPLASMILNQENLLTTITFGIHDLGYNERFIKYCAKRMERKSENYLDAVMGDFKKIITQMGLTLSDDIYHIVKAFNSPQSKIEFKFMPENLSNLQYFNQYEINQWPYILGMTVKVNGKDYNDFSFKINKKTEVEKEQKLNKTESLKSKEPLVEAPNRK